MIGRRGSMQSSSSPEYQPGEGQETTADPPPAIPEKECVHQRVGVSSLHDGYGHTQSKAFHTSGTMSLKSSEDPTTQQNSPVLNKSRLF